MSAVLDQNLFAPATKVLGLAPADPADAHAYFLTRLRSESDCSDVATDLENGVTGFTVLDVRGADAYREEHVRGAVSFPHAEITAESVADLDRDTVYVTYCWFPGCNAATKAGAKLTALGFRAKEMIGGIEYWKRQGFPTETGS